MNDELNAGHEILSKIYSLKNAIQKSYRYMTAHEYQRMTLPMKEIELSARLYILSREHIDKNQV